MEDSGDDYFSARRGYTVPPSDLFMEPDAFISKVSLAEPFSASCGLSTSLVQFGDGASREGMMIMVSSWLAVEAHRGLRRSLAGPAHDERHGPDHGGVPHGRRLSQVLQGLC
jgi:hypothetical protein